MAKDFTSLQISDLDWLSRFLKQEMFKDWSVSGLKDLLDKNHIESLTLHENGCLTAFIIVSYVAPEAEIIAFGVSPDQRGKGYATQLFEAMVSRLNKKGLKRMFLDVAEYNQGALAFYKKQGFEVLNRRKGYYSHYQNYQDVDALVMAKDFG